MASLIEAKRKRGAVFVVQLSPHENPKRPKLSLGRCSRKDAERIKNHIENLFEAQQENIEISPLSESEKIREALKWCNGTSGRIREGLIRIGLVAGEKKSKVKPTVSKFIAQYIESRKDVKESTLRRMQDVQKKINVLFGNDPIDKITVRDAKNFRIYLKTTAKLGENTARRHTGICRQFFTAAIEAGWIEKNPFKAKGLPVSVRPNEAKSFYVSRETAQKVLNACPDSQWRLIFGLARFGGLRCPSEILRLTWEDIDFEHDRFTVHASKTEHHANSGIRVVPMFPELKPLFQDAFDLAEEGAVYCITQYRDTGTNLRTQLGRILKKAGLVPWIKPFQNCRSTRETELFKETGNIKAVCSWIGNSEVVALRHYAQLTESDMKAAAEKAVLDGAKKRVQNRVQNSGADECKPAHEETDETGINPEKSGFYTDKPRNQDPQKMGRAGDELQNLSAREKAFYEYMNKTRAQKRVHG